jgi:hypothetical protein
MSLGAWGVDASQSIVWAVLNHNSQFGVMMVPEPNSITLALIACGGFLLRRRSRFTRS